MNKRIKKLVRNWIVSVANETDPARRKKLLEETASIAEQVRQIHGSSFSEAFQMLAREQQMKREPIGVLATRFAMVLELLRNR